MNPQTPEDGEAFAAITRIVAQRDALCAAVKTLQTRYDDALARIATIERDSTKLRETLQNAIGCLVVCADDLELAGLPHESVRTDIADYQAVLEASNSREPVAEANAPGVGCLESAPACPPGCGHTVQEHTAFDHGLRDGEEGQADSQNPYRARDLRESWATGHSVGVLNRRATRSSPS